MTEAALIPTAAQKLSDRDFDRFRALAYEYCGLAIDKGKEILVSSRLSKVMRGLNMQSFSEYYDYVVGDKTSAALVTMIDSLTTNYTNFFREPKHFEFLEQVIFPALAHRAELPIWSAACSTGEEPYSVAIAAREFFGEAGPRVHLLATDISTRALNAAQKALYEEKDVAQLPVELCRKYLLRGTGPESGRIRVKSAVRDMVEFQRMNLTAAFPPAIGTFPLILCRNVMIYFDSQTQQALVRQFSQQLEPGGYLFVGHSESLNAIDHNLEYVRPAVYRRTGTLVSR